jgi:hypothetical protein
MSSYLWNKPIMKKGMFFTIDALFALLLAFTFFIYITYYFSGYSNSAYKQMDLSVASTDALAVLEKTSTLDSAVRALSNTQIQTYLNALPTQFCANITLYNSANLKLLSALKSGCTAAEENAIVRRVFVSHQDPYLAVMESWYYG